MKRFFHLPIFLLFLFACCAVPAMAQTVDYRLVHEGNREFKKKHYDRAATYYMKALKRNPNNARALFNLGDTYLAQHNVQAADSLYMRAAQTEKNPLICAMAWHNRGYISQMQALSDQQNQQQLLRQAIEHYKQALRLNPHDEDTRYNLALCQKQLKDSQQNKQQNQQQQKKQQQQQQSQNKQQPKQNKQQPEQQKQQEEEIRQTEQYLNLAKQAEQRALKKINAQQPRQKALNKNW